MIPEPFDRSTYGTPKQVFDTLDRMYRFDVDICAESHTAKCERWYGKQQNSLGFKWHQIPNCKWIWCNPPYNDVMPWVCKAIDSQLNGVGVVMLLNDDASVGWYAEALMYVSKIIRITASSKNLTEYSNGRLDFIDNTGKPAKGNPRGQVLFEFDPSHVGKRETVYATKNQLMGEV
jgi:phage N-6-adenine-methyltransferase